MTKSHTAKKSPASAPGTKALITAASLALTLGGWAAYTRAPADTAGPAGPPLAIAITLSRPSTELKLAPQLLPTIIPALPLPPKLAIARPPIIPAALLNDSAPVFAPAAAPRPQAAAPFAQPAAPAPEPPAAVQLPAGAPLLRAVSAPPQPVARTRSSK
jgi:hypothetical protein